MVGGTVVVETEREPDGRYGWWVVGVGTLAMAFTFGTPYSYGVFLDPFGETYDIPLVLLSTVFSVHLFAFFVGAGVIGILVTHVPARRVLAGTGIVTGLVAPSLYVVDSYLGLLVVFSVLGTALGTVYVVLASVVPQWFHSRRGTASGILLAGVGISLFVLPPTWRLAFDSIGVQRGFAIVLSVHAVAFLVAAGVCKRPTWADRSPLSTSELGSWTVRLIRTRTFQLTALGIGLSFAWYNLLAAYSIDLFNSRGLSAYGASVAFGLIGGVSIVSRIGSGAIADRIGFRRTYLVFLACAVLGSALLFVPQLPVLGLAVFVYGLSLGGIGALYIPVLLQTFDPTKDTAIVGIFNVVLGVFAIAAPPVGTSLVVFTGSYTPVIVVTLLSTLGALWALHAADDRVRV